MNKYIATGRLTRNPEVKQSQGGKSYSQFSIAVDRSFVGPSGFLVNLPYLFMFCCLH